MMEIAIILGDIEKLPELSILALGVDSKNGANWRFRRVMKPGGRFRHSCADVECILLYYRHCEMELETWALLQPWFWTIPLDELKIKFYNITYILRYNIAIILCFVFVFVRWEIEGKDHELTQSGRRTSKSQSLCPGLVFGISRPLVFQFSLLLQPGPPHWNSPHLLLSLRLNLIPNFSCHFRHIRDRPAKRQRPQWV